MTHTEEQMTEVESPVAPGAVVDGYRVERVITVREGSHTLVEATAPSGQRVTLKLLADPLEGKELRRRAANLARVQASIAHPHVLSILDDGKSRERFCFGGAPAGSVSLADRLRDAPLPPTEAVVLLSQLAGALETARRRGLVHRALTPAAVVVTTEEPPRALLTDFGIAVPDAPGCESAESVEDSDYRSPEELRGEPPTPQSTVYSVACILVACLTGAPPYPYHRPLLAVHAHLKEPPPRLSERNRDLPQELDEVVGKALAKRPGDRYGSPVALMRAVQRALGIMAPIPGPSAAKRQESTTPAPEPAAVPSAEPEEAPAPPEPEPEYAARPHKPGGARRWRSRSRGARHERARGWATARGMLPTWAGIALLASALAGFAAGNGGSEDRKRPVAAAPAAVEQTSRPVAESRRPTVGPVVERLEKRRAVARRRLRAARRPAGQAAIATHLARIYRDAGRSLLRSPAKAGQNEQLADRMRAVERAYGRLARAARRGPRAWRLASAEVLDSERDLELLLRTRSWI
jgi:hypothetical protein